MILAQQYKNRELERFKVPLAAQEPFKSKVPGHISTIGQASAGVRDICNSKGEVKSRFVPGTREEEIECVTQMKEYACADDSAKAAKLHTKIRAQPGLPKHWHEYSIQAKNVLGEKDTLKICLKKENNSDLCKDREFYMSTNSIKAPVQDSKLYVKHVDKNFYLLVTTRNQIAFPLYYN